MQLVLPRLISLPEGLQASSSDSTRSDETVQMLAGFVGCVLDGAEASPAHYRSRAVVLATSPPLLAALSNVMAHRQHLALSSVTALLGVIERAAALAAETWAHGLRSELAVLCEDLPWPTTLPLIALLGPRPPPQHATVVSLLLCARSMEGAASAVKSSLVDILRDNSQPLLSALACVLPRSTPPEAKRVLRALRNFLEADEGDLTDEGQSLQLLGKLHGALLYALSLVEGAARQDIECMVITLRAIALLRSADAEGSDVVFTYLITFGTDILHTATTSRTLRGIEEAVQCAALFVIACRASCVAWTVEASERLAVWALDLAEKLCSARLDCGAAQQCATSVKLAISESTFSDDKKLLLMNALRTGDGEFFSPQQ